jgi:hypothetical protein
MSTIAYHADFIVYYISLLPHREYYEDVFGLIGTHGTHGTRNTKVPVVLIY